MTNPTCAGDANSLLVISKKFTTKVLYEILTKYTKTNDVVLDGWSEIKTNDKKGDSYLSVLYRFSIYGQITANSQKVTVPIVVKGFPSNMGRRKTFRSTDFFAAEINFYVKVWSRMRQFEEEKGVEPTHIPVCLAAVCDGENDFIVFEDLSKSGYTNIDRASAVDLDHAYLIMQLFANFHATSFAFKAQNPKEFERLASSLKETYFAEEYRDWYKNFAKSLHIAWTDALEKEVPGSIYEKKFKELIANDFFGLTVRTVQDKGKFAVVTQGDAWICNFLLKYDKNKPVSATLIDFQLSRYSSLVVDLAFFIFVAIDHECRIKHFNDILRVYHNQFTKRLVELGSDASLFTWDDFQEEFRKYGKTGLSMCLEATPVSLLSDDEVTDLDAMTGDDPTDIVNIFNAKPLPTKEKRMVLVNVMKDFVDLGYI